MSLWGHFSWNLSWEFYNEFAQFVNFYFFGKFFFFLVYKNWTCNCVYTISIKFVGRDKIQTHDLSVVNSAAFVTLNYLLILGISLLSRTDLLPRLQVHLLFLPARRCRGVRRPLLLRLPREGVQLPVRPLHLACIHGSLDPLLAAKYSSRKR